MSPERAAALVARWVRRYTRGLPAAVAERRVEEIDADLRDHLAHARSAGTSERRIALGIVSRMVRGLPADASWRRHHVRARGERATAHDAMATDRSLYRRGLGVALGAVLVLVWMVGALGIIGDAGDGADSMYLGVLAVGAVGSVVARFRPDGMARALLATAAAQASVAVIALVGGLVPSYNSPFEILALNGFFVALFATSAWLFRRAGSGRRPAGGGPAS